ncbi:hypothetical protein ACQKWADRAFT_238239 [Trichoderma austrokoningii]
MERKRAIQGTTDFHSTTMVPGLPYSNQVLLPSSHAQRRALPGAHYNMMANSQYMPEGSPYDFPSMGEAYHAQSTVKTLKMADPEEEAYRPSKARKAARKTKTPKRADHLTFLSKVLSEVSSMSPSIVLKNAELFATRATEVRLAEADKAGKIKRPLNAFMLYRKFYQDVAKTCCTKNNHQQVSTVCGESWKREQKHLKNEFARLAAEERRMHVEAFPSYKYDPLHSKKRDDKDSMVSLPLDKDGFEHSSGRALPEENKLKRKLKEVPEYHEPLHLSNSIYPPIVEQQQVFMRPVATQAYWAPQPVQVGPYYEERTYQVDAGPFQPYQPWHGDDYFPAGNTHLIMNGLHGAAMERGLSAQDTCIDPILLPCSPSSRYDLPGGSGSSAAQEQWNHGRHAEASRAESGLDVRNYDAYLKGTDSDWKVEHLDEPSQFDDWMSQIEGEI